MEKPTPNASRPGAPAVLFAYVLGGALVPLFIRYLTFHFDSVTVNLYRLASGGLLLLILAGVFRRAQLRAFLQDGRLLLGAGLLTLVTFPAQFLVTEGTRYTSAAVAAMIGLLGIPLTALAAAVLYRDERRLLAQPRFVMGVCLALLGALAMAWGPRSLGSVYVTGVLLLLAASLLGVVSALLAKRLAARSHVLPLAAASALVSAACFAVTSVWLGHVADPFRGPATASFWLVFSGAFGIVVGIGLYFLAIQRQGLVVTKLAELAMPLFTVLVAWPLLGETPTLLQIGSGLVIIVACALLLSAQRRLACLTAPATVATLAAAPTPEPMPAIAPVSPPADTRCRNDR